MLKVLLAVEAFLIPTFLGVPVVEVLLFLAGGFSATEPSPLRALDSRGWET